MFSWTDKFSQDPYPPPIQEELDRLVARQRELAEGALREALTKLDSLLVREYLDGKLDITETQLRDMLERDYEVVYQDGIFIEVRVKEKNNG